MASNTMPPVVRGLNFYALDQNVKYFLERTNPQMLKRQQGRLTDLGAWVGNELDVQAEYSDRHAPPKLVHDIIPAGKPGERTGRVVFNPAYEDAQIEIYRRGVIGLAFQDKNPEPHSLSFVMGYLLSQTDISTHCPVTMTGAVAYVVNKYGSNDVKKRFLHESTRMDGLAKTGGTWATEKHSGSDVANTTTTARKHFDGSYRLNGQKWFASNASSGLAVATARAEGTTGAKGLGLYLVPSHVDKDWTKPNSYHVTKLKEKLGTRALATAELLLDDTYAIELVPPPHGLRVMMEALGYSRVHNAMSAAGVAHRALLEVRCWMDNRETFGKALSDRPMNQKHMIGMSVDWMAACALAFEAAHSFDVSQGNDATAQSWMRMVTAIAKYRTADLAVKSANIAVQMVGGNGYTADWPTERLMRDALVLQVWEGPRQIQALELTRVILGPEKGAESFIKNLNAIAKALPPEMKTERALLKRKSAEIAGMMGDLVKNPQTAEFVADEILDAAADILTYALMAREAAWELKHHNDSTKSLALQKLAETTFGQIKQAGYNVDTLADDFNRLVRGVVSPTPTPAKKTGPNGPAPV